uniref:Acyl carrier protein n=1 Tax=Ananas comosus var. bracteatus TaxID=296719 RepID=A0A6V7PCF1_ANACO|nr:unnamed protein product [Ananas comosus var. bracteatus]
MAVAAARWALLRRLRVAAGAPAMPPPTSSSLSSSSPSSLGRFFFFVGRRGFSEEVKGSFLDKGEVTDRVISVIKNFQKVDPPRLGNYCDSNNQVTPNAHFQKDLGLDSLDTVEIVMAFEEEFGFEIPDNEADKIDSIKVAVDFVASHPQAK